jgi:hypothetical protein
MLSVKIEFQATMVLRSRKFYGTTFGCLKNDLTLANLVFKIPAIKVEKYLVFSSFILHRFHFKTWRMDAPEEGK